MSYIRDSRQYLFHSLTFTIIEEIEKKCGCICFSSNQVLIWQMLRLAEIDHNLRGYGKLLSKS